MHVYLESRSCGACWLVVLTRVSFHGESAPRCTYRHLIGGGGLLLLLPCYGFCLANCSLQISPCEWVLISIANNTDPTKPFASTKTKVHTHKHRGHAQRRQWAKNTTNWIHSVIIRSEHHSGSQSWDEELFLIRDLCILVSSSKLIY